jgi:SpoVK/Ycf46/Vps4 family AAA+-type ATPase
MRKGRFDEIFFVDLPGIEARRSIISVHLSKRKREPDKFDLDALVEASAGYSGAEIEQAIVSALHNAYSAKQALTTDHVLLAMWSSRPLSVTMAERIGELRRWAEGRCVPAD